MRKSFLSAIALTFMIAPVMTSYDASAQSRREIRQELREDRRELREDRREIRRDRREIRREVRRDRLQRGGRYRSGGTRVGDYRRYGLRAPGRGQRWVRYNNDFLLVSIASGLIGAIIAGR